MSDIRIRLSRPRKPAEPLPPPMQPMEPVIWHETGGWTVGLQDDAEDFPSRTFALAAWLRRQHRDVRVRQ
jgi:hypothetical protein